MSITFRGQCINLMSIEAQTVMMDWELIPYYTSRLHPGYWAYLRPRVWTTWIYRSIIQYKKKII